MLTRETGMPISMRALSIQQPWLDAIIRGGKRVENRSWMPPDRAIGIKVALHASRKADLGAVMPWGCGYVPPSPEAWPLGAVAAVAVISAAHGGLCGVSRPACSPWAVPGQNHWLLTDVRPLAEPVPCRGSLGLWKLPADVEAAVREQIAAATVQEAGRA